MGTKANLAARTGDKVQIGDDPSFQDRSWIIQRVCWAVLVVVLLAAAVGAFGSGGISRTTAGSREAGLWIDYARIARQSTPVEVAVHVDRRLVEGDSLRLVLGGDYVREAQLDSLLPRPTGGGTAAHGAVLSFDVMGNDGILRVVLQLKFSGAGLIEGEIGLLGGRTLKVSHLIYP